VIFATEKLRAKKEKKRKEAKNSPKYLKQNTEVLNKICAPKKKKSRTRLPSFSHIPARKKNLKVKKTEFLLIFLEFDAQFLIAIFEKTYYLAELFYLSALKSKDHDLSSDIFIIPQ